MRVRRTYRGARAALCHRYEQCAGGRLHLACSPWHGCGKAYVSAQRHADVDSHAPPAAQQAASHRLGRLRAHGFEVGRRPLCRTVKSATGVRPSARRRVRVWVWARRRRHLHLPWRSSAQRWATASQTAARRLDRAQSGRTTLQSERRAAAREGGWPRAWSQRARSCPPPHPHPPGWHRQVAALGCAQRQDGVCRAFFTAARKLLRNCGKRLPQRGWPMGCGASSEAAGPEDPTPVDAPLKPVVAVASTAPSAVPAGDAGAGPKFVPSQHSRDTLDKGFAAGDVVSATHLPSHKRRPSLDNRFFEAAEAAQRRQHAWLAAAHAATTVPTGSTHARGSGFPLGLGPSQNRLIGCDSPQLGSAWGMLWREKKPPASQLSH